MQRKPLSAKSAKRKRDDRLRKVLVTQYLTANPNCAAQLAGCRGRAETVHEIIQRSVHPGAQLEPRLFLGLCDSCHTYISDNWSWAWNHGYVLKSWQNSSGWLLQAKRIRGWYCARSKHCTETHIEDIIESLLEDE